jgi:microcin C transport system substrate-binding protein
MKVAHGIGLLTLLLAASVSAQDLSQIKWETNNEDPPIGDPARAIKGGTLNDHMPGFPKTFRTFGPNSNEMWANWRNGYMQAIGVISRHPQTDRFIPGLASHWAVMEDNKTVYFKLDPDAMWSDGVPITSADYVFALETMKNPAILDPFVNQLANDYYESVEAIDTHTIKVIGKQPSWRALEDLAIGPMPKHAIKIEPGWEVRDNYTPPVVQGPYTIGEVKKGESVELVRNPSWWGYKKHYYKGMFNPDRIVMRVIADREATLDFFKKGELDFYMVMSARQWATELELQEVAKGWMHKRMIYTQTPDGMSGIGMNLKQPIFQNKDFRKAIQYGFNFERLNREIMFDAYFRKVSAFDGTEYANPNLKGYGFQPKLAVEHLRKAGFAKVGSDGIRVNDAGQRATFTLIYGTEAFNRHLGVIQQDYKRLGVEINLQYLEPSTYFEKVREKASEAFMVSMTGGFYPEPYQYFASTFADEPQTNNFWAFKNEEADKLIDTYRFNMDKPQRLAAMHRLDELIADEAFYLPFWSASFMRFLYWDYVEFPADYFPRRTESYMENPVYWINSEKKAALEKAMKDGQTLPASGVPVEIDPHGVKPKG